jgi:ornithine carbamoyltransferase
MIVSTLFGYEIHVARPKGYEPTPKIMKFISEKNAKIVFTENLTEAFENADVIYANTWHSMGGPEAEKEKRLQHWREFQANLENTKVSNPDFIFMHCLPGYRGEEMTDEIIEGSHSVVWDQAENRMHTEKAVLSLFIS